MLLLKKNGSVVGSALEGGWVTFPDGKKLSPATEGWTDGEYVLEAEPQPPAPTPAEILAQERAEMQLSFAQLIIGLVTEAWITEADGDGWLTGVLPSTVLTTINLLPAEQRFAARAKAARPSVVLRLDPLVEMMALAQGRSPAEIDTFFRTYASV